MTNHLKSEKKEEDFLIILRATHFILELLLTIDKYKNQNQLQVESLIDICKNIK